MKFNISQYSIRNRHIIWLFLAIMLVGGVYAFEVLGKREDSTFKIKSAVVTCPYPGATPEEVEQLVAIPMERSLRTLGSVRKITSESHFGYARIVVELHPSTPAERIPQLWDELRRKVDAVAQTLPEGVGAIGIADDFGDVYGMYYAIVGDGGYSWDELRSYARAVETQLYTIDGVDKVMLVGEQSPEIAVVISPATLATFELKPDAIARAIAEQNNVASLGTRRAGDVEIELAEGTTYMSVEDIENQLLSATDGKQYRLGDVARVERRYKEPASLLLSVDGRRAIGVAVASNPEMDIVSVGDSVEEVLAFMSRRLPAGVEIVTLYPENEIAREATDDFLVNLVESVAIVVLLIMLTMGLRSGVVVGSSLIFCIGATLLIMLFIGEGLNRTSLAGFIIAMGMLVDNAIVVVDNSRMLLRRNLSLNEAMVQGATTPRMGLLAATLIAIISFLPLQLAPSSAAEIIRPLFVVIAISLLMSWVLALTQVPAMGAMLLKAPAKVQPIERSVWFYRVVRWLMRHRIAVVCVIISLFVLSLWGMGRMPQNFFPQLSKPYFRADVLLPEGYDIEATQASLDDMVGWLQAQPEVKRVSTTAGGTPPRYYLASGSYASRPNYGNLLVELHDKEHTARVEQRFDEWVTANMPDVWLRSSLFKLSPVPDATIEFGFVGENVDTLLALTKRAMQIMWQSGEARNVRNSWGNRVAVWQPRYSQIKAQRIGVERSSMVRSLELATSGLRVATYREAELSMPILLRSTALADTTLAALRTMPVFSTAGNAFSIEQASSGFDFDFRTSVIKRINSERVMKAQCDPKRGVNAIALLDKLRRDIEADISLADGYRMELYGDEESREESNRAIVEKLPLTLILIFLILLLLFGRYRDTLVVVITIPLIFIGVVLGLLLFGKMFDFFSLLGLLGLIGMNVKNAVILISRITELRGMGVAPVDAVARAAADRLVPVVTASGTTVLGLVPLLFDSMFGGMAATIMGGLVVATMLVLMVLPVVYSLFYRIKS